MPLRTYPLIVHPAFLAFVEHQKGRDHGLYGIKPVETPTHRPEIRTITDVADYLQISHFFLRTVMRKPEKHYRVFYFKKRLGGFREICSPRTFLKVIQWWILDTILYNAELSPAVHGFVPYKSFITNAREHIGARRVLNVDVADFFPSLRAKIVAEAFGSLGYSEKISIDFAKLTTLRDALPQGAPTSPAIANLILRNFDEAMLRYAESAGMRYTRYADDLTFSSNGFISASLLDFIADNLAPLGLRLNEKKTRFMGPNTLKEVTGLILGKDDIRLPRETLNAARGWFYRISRNPADFKEHLDRVRGTLSLIRYVGGAGSAPVVSLGSSAMTAIEKSFFTSSNDW